jgi:hypothetical protein
MKEDYYQMSWPQHLALLLRVEEIPGSVIGPETNYPDRGFCGSLLSIQESIRIVSYIMHEWMGHVACVGEIRNAFKVLIRKFQRKRPLAKPRHIGRMILM